MRTSKKQIVDFSGPEIKGTDNFFVSLHHGIEYVEKEKVWVVEAERGFIQYTLICDEPVDVHGTAELAASQDHDAPRAASSIVVNGFHFVPEFEVLDGEFQVLEWDVPAQFFFKGANTIITPLHPGATASVLVKEVTATW